MARFSHIAGDAALDLLNTVEWRLADGGREENLNDFGDLVAWCREAGLIDGEEADALPVPSGDDAATEHVRVLALREALYGALFSDEAGGGQLITDELHQALAAADYDPTADGWRWHDRQLTSATPRHRIARAIMALLSRSDLNRLHQCEDAQCGWVFLDTSRAHNRRWCVTKDCGDRNRSRAYYARQRAKN